MYILAKTPKGTIGAWHNPCMISAGIYGQDNCVSLEYNPMTGNLELLLMDKRIEEQGFVIKHVDENWQEIKEEQL